MSVRMLASFAAVALGVLVSSSTASGSDLEARSDTAAVPFAPSTALRAAGFGLRPSPLFVGAMSTIAPPLIAMALAPPGTNSDFAPEAALVVASGIGVIVGPAVGLGYGGRQDLARRGLVARGIGTGMVFVGLLGVAQMLENEQSSPLGYAMFGTGVAGTAVIALSAVHDLAITPSATAERNRPRADLGIRPDGRVAVRVRF